MFIKTKNATISHPLNIDMVIAFYKDHSDEGFVIRFQFNHHCMDWIYADEKSRDTDYDSLMYHTNLV